MPSSITHTYFGDDVLNKCGIKIKNKIDIEYFKTFCQGADIFYFYNLFIGNKSKKISNIGSFIHCNDTRKFFKILIYYIYENNLYNNRGVVSFLYGYMCHYFLDSTVHPYIFYKTGKFYKNNKDTYKYNSLHAELEFYIDRYLIYKNEGINPSKYRVHDIFLNILKFDIDLSKTINYTFKNMGFTNNIDKIYLKSIKDMRIFFRIFNYDYWAIKKRFYFLIDRISPSWVVKVKSLSYSREYGINNDYLNLNKNTWTNPCDDSLSYNYTFFDLYDLALDKCVKDIKKIHLMFKNNYIDDKVLDDIFKNLSYVSGIDCDKKLDFKYFEF